MAHEQPFIIDHSDAVQHARFVSRVSGLRGTGKRAWTSKPHKPKRSLKANAYMWAIVYPTFQRYMRDNGQFFELEEIHEFFLQRLAGRPVIDPKSGELLCTVGRRSSQMDSTEFSQYLNDVIGWMQDRHGLYVPSPEDFAPAKPLARRQEVGQPA